MSLRRLVKEHCSIVEIILSIFLTSGLLYYFGEIKTRKYLLALLVFAATFLIVRFSKVYYSKRRLKFSLFFSVIFSFFCWFGWRVATLGESTSKSFIFDFPLIVILIILFLLISVIIFGFIDKYKLKIKKSKHNTKQWWVYGGIIILCWLPVILVFFPGLISNDSAVQIRQAVGEDVWSNWHPVLHTLFVAIPVNVGRAIFGDLTAGIALSTITQVLVLAGIFGYVVRWVKEVTNKEWIGNVLLVFFALCPINACLSVAMWKDVLFSAVFLLLVVKLCDLVIKKKRYDVIKFRDLWVILVLVLLVGFLRNGGVLIVIGVAIAMLMYFAQSRKLLLMGFGAIIGLILVIQGPVYKLLNISSSPMMESLSVPAQQIGYIVQNDEIDESSMEELSKYADVSCLVQNYSSMDADRAKNCFDYDTVEKDKIGFLMLWVKLLPNHLDGYTTAHLLNSYSYWYVGGDSWVLSFENDHDKQWLEMEYSDVSLLGDTIKGIVRRVEGGLMDTVIISWMCNIGVLFWGMCYVAVILIYQKRYVFLVPMIGVFVYMASLLIASPISSMFRYVYSLMLILPVMVIILFTSFNNPERRKK